MVCSLVADYTYAFKQTFARWEVFAGYVGLLALRCLFPILIAFKNVCSRVCSREKNMLPQMIYEGKDLQSAISY